VRGGSEGGVNTFAWGGLLGKEPAGAVFLPPQPVGVIVAAGGRSESWIWGGVAGGWVVGSRTGERGVSSFAFGGGPEACCCGE
jgi:hypothetical protein